MKKIIGITLLALVLTACGDAASNTKYENPDTSYSGFSERSTENENNEVPL